MKEFKNYLDTLPILPSERHELEQALERRNSSYWVSARKEIKELAEIRIEEKQNRKLKALLTDDKVNQLVKIDDVLMGYIQELWEYGYSSGAIAKGLGYAVSAARISQKMDAIPKSIHKRGQVIELLNNFEVDFDFKKWKCQSSVKYKQGPKIKESEKARFKELYNKGFGIAEISRITHRSENAVRKWVRS